MAQTIHMRLARDGDGRPVDSVHVHGYASPEESATAEKLVWHALGRDGSAVPEGLGRIGADERSTPLAITQMVLMHHVLAAGR
jgi:phosphoribulokinase